MLPKYVYVMDANFWSFLIFGAFLKIHSSVTLFLGSARYDGENHNLYSVFQLKSIHIHIQILESTMLPHTSRSVSATQNIYLGVGAGGRVVEVLCRLLPRKF
jgi:hypothetical protein